ncbi:MAG: hypothetical protein JOZ39_03360 [Chloroflexi bacterium]|nr:hypothetical protein [Chloroflexota bacterium]
MPQGMQDNVSREAIKHPEKMGPLGDTPDHPRDGAERVAVSMNTPTLQEQASIADREQITTQE